MIGVIPKESQRQVVEEFFELFKTPWEWYRPGHAYDVVIATAAEIPEVSAKLLLAYDPDTTDIDARFGIVAHQRKRNANLCYRDTSLPIYGDLLTFTAAGDRIHCATSSSEIAGLKLGDSDRVVIRLGYDLFDEVQFLLSVGQPVEHAHVPTLEIHIQMLREWILSAGIPILEVPPVPAGHSFATALTHDIDFIGIRLHKFDATVWGFIYRATVGALRNIVRARLTLAQLLRSWLAVASLPFVYAGWVKDFWEPFEWFLRVERGLPATYFLIPFKRRPGEKVEGRHASRRATAYDIADIPDSVTALLKEGCEVGVHGIDAWHSADKSRDELVQVKTITGESDIGIRMHWLLKDANTPSVLEQAGYAYDSTYGYNETIGYRSGTGQVFRLSGAQTLLELPLHIQDGALFYPRRLDLSEPQAEKLCQDLIDNARKFGGVLTILWHDRSHAPERFWGDFYVRLVQKLRALDAWFGTAAQVVGWFRKRRQMRFERLEATPGVRCTLRGQKDVGLPSFRLRIYRPTSVSNGGQPRDEWEQSFIDIPWNGENIVEFGSSLNKVTEDQVHVVCGGLF